MARGRVTAAALAAAVAAAALGRAGVQAYTEVWPWPQEMTTGSQLTYLGEEFTISCTGLCPDPLAAAFVRYNSLIFFAGAPVPPPAQANVVTGLNVTVGADVPLEYGVSENYTLSVPTNGVAVLTAPTQWGALRGLESFSQLPQWGTPTGVSQYTIDAAPVSITDWPRWNWRSLLIDSSRHFLTVSAILVTLDGMSYNKLNTLHWHVVDDNSWPLYVESYPNFTLGAYAPTAIYSHADVQTIVQYAWERGIRIIPEFDMPAHADIWGVGYPNLVISCDDGQTLLNPTDNGGVYQAVEALLDEFTPLFGNQVIHFGGDEVEDLTCWNQSAEVQAFMKANGIPNVNAMRNYFESKLQAIAQSKGLAAMFWEEVFDDGYTLLNTTIIDIWLSYDEVVNVLKSGHPAVCSFGYYLDQQIPFGPEHYFWADTWQNFWLNDPTVNTTLTPEESALLLGGSLSQWGEQVDAANIESRVWPRACGGAERFWSAASLRNVTEAEGRLSHMRCHLVQRGIGAGPIRPSSEYGYCPLPGLSRFHRMHFGSHA